MLPIAIFVARYLISKREATCQGLPKHCFWSCLPIFWIVVIISTYKLLIALLLSFDPDMYLFYRSKDRTLSELQHSECYRVVVSYEGLQRNT